VISNKAQTIDQAAYRKWVKLFDVGKCPFFNIFDQLTFLNLKPFALIS